MFGSAGAQPTGWGELKAEAAQCAAFPIFTP